MILQEMRSVMNSSGKIGLRIRVLRERLGFVNQTVFAKAVKATQGTVSDWERGTTKDISLASLTIIANLCEDSDRVLTWLITGKEMPVIKRKH